MATGTSLSAGATPVIINKLGVVHRVKRDGTTCPIATEAVSDRRQRPLPVTPLQCLVYNLACCRICWPSQVDFDRFAGRMGGV